MLSCNRGIFGLKSLELPRKPGEGPSSNETNGTINGHVPYQPTIRPISRLLSDNTAIPPPLSVPGAQSAHTLPAVGMVNANNAPPGIGSHIGMNNMSSYMPGMHSVPGVSANLQNALPGTTNAMPGMNYPQNAVPHGMPNGIQSLPGMHNLQMESHGMHNSVTSMQNVPSQVNTVMNQGATAVPGACMPYSTPASNAYNHRGNSVYHAPYHTMSAPLNGAASVSGIHNRPMSMSVPAATSLSGIQNMLDAYNQMPSSTTVHQQTPAIPPPPGMSALNSAQTNNNAFNPGMQNFTSDMMSGLPTAADNISVPAFTSTTKQDPPKKYPPGFGYPTSTATVEATTPASEYKTYPQTTRTNTAADMNSYKTLQDHTEVKHASNNTHDNGSTRSSSGIGKAKSVKRLRAGYNYKANPDGPMGTELSMTQGEHLILLEKTNDNWWMAENQRGEQGLVPASYVISVDEGNSLPWLPAKKEEPKATPAMATAGARVTYRPSYDHPELDCKAGSDANMKKYYCEPCGKQLNGPYPYNTHINSKKHKEYVEELGL